MKVLTTHRVEIADARDMRAVPDASVELVVTSPPYPMIEMWDGLYAELAPASAEHLAAHRGMAAFEVQHRVLDRVWEECRRVLVSGGIVAINIGDATRTLGEFGLYPNHARITMCMVALGFTPLPDILWRKPTNAPNKFMGSGMLPPGAYVTYEHEYVLVFRKGGKRIFKEKALRAASAYFWEERNVWFSDLWSDVRGAGQRPVPGRARSAAFPFELPYRLIQMYSVYGDTVLDPFVGTGTTLCAAVASSRNSIAIEREAAFGDVIQESIVQGVDAGVRRVAERLTAHGAFVGARPAGPHRSEVYGFGVVTRQEVGLRLLVPTGVRHEGGEWRGEHEG